MYNKQLIGKIGENLACEFLRKNKYIIIERNFRCRQGEIDIIATDTESKEIVFLEVKTRTNLKYGEGAEAVNSLKRKHIYMCVEYYIYINKIKNIPIRLDVIEIYFKEGKFEINHIKQAME